MRDQSWIRVSAIPAIGLLAMLAGCGDDDVTNTVPPLNAFTQTNLVADLAGMGAATVDSSLVNPWGIVFGPTGNLWVANNGSSTSTAYDASGKSLGITVSIPGNDPAKGASPTGIAFNSTTDFVMQGGGAAQFMFAAEDGTISAWNASTTAQVVVNRSSNGAVYKGAAIAISNGANFLYATDFKNNSVDVFDKSFALVKRFTDPTVPAGYAPFGITNIAGRLFITFAKQQGPDNVDDAPGVGNGFVDVFDPDGTPLRRFAANGHLNSPWGVASAPAGFGLFGGAILIGNFGDGLINVYDQSGNFVDVLRDAAAAPIAISGLWGLAFGPVIPGLQSTTLYFSAGPSGESHGLVGTLTPR